MTITEKLASSRRFKIKCSFRLILSGQSSHFISPPSLSLFLLFRFLTQVISLLVFSSALLPSSHLLRFSHMFGQTWTSLDSRGPSSIRWCGVRLNRPRFLPDPAFVAVNHSSHWIDFLVSCHWRVQTGVFLVLELNVNLNTRAALLTASLMLFSSIKNVFTYSWNVLIFL